MWIILCFSENRWTFSYLFMLSSDVEYASVFPAPGILSSIGAKFSLIERSPLISLLRFGSAFDSVTPALSVVWSMVSFALDTTAISWVQLSSVDFNGSPWVVFCAVVMIWILCSSQLNRGPSSRLRTLISAYVGDSTSFETEFVNRLRYFFFFGSDSVNKRIETFKNNWYVYTYLIYCPWTYGYGHILWAYGYGHILWHHGHRSPSSSSSDTSATLSLAKFPQFDSLDFFLPPITSQNLSNFLPTPFISIV